ncbi:MAG: DUF3990 domain-containing protein [Bacteroidales bacterium]|nr:DUF3990 domain-containing protein [Bacteroidales bacterium]
MSEKLGEKIMSNLIVYHGGTEEVKTPICKFGRPNLDFGQGFYVTELRNQAVSWALQMADRRKQPPVLNVYFLDRDAVLSEFRCKIFHAYDEDWLGFIVASRKGENVAAKYDYIEGGVANDRVVDTVNLYMAGLMDLNTALARLSEHQPNNQMCLLNQTIVDKYLIFNGTETI